MPPSNHRVFGGSHWRMVLGASNQCSSAASSPQKPSGSSMLRRYIASYVSRAPTRAAAAKASGGSNRRDSLDTLTMALVIGTSTPGLTTDRCGSAVGGPQLGRCGRVRPEGSSGAVHRGGRRRWRSPACAGARIDVPPRPRPGPNRAAVGDSATRPTARGDGTAGDELVGTVGTVGTLASQRGPVLSWPASPVRLHAFRAWRRAGRKSERERCRRNCLSAGCPGAPPTIG